ncbi:hypothetical protein VTL71DRAFT_12531 [Oculimacula yallundae]|uniref:Uncharacterized protein n=1 Tax=Oculimacula yallundae TaxID=86028 RepID=A0ABR4CQ14_9HELO
MPATSNPSSSRPPPRATLPSESLGISVSINGSLPSTTWKARSVTVLGSSSEPHWPYPKREPTIHFPSFCPGTAWLAMEQLLELKSKKEEESSNSYVLGLMHNDMDTPSTNGNGYFYDMVLSISLTLVTGKSWTGRCECTYLLAYPTYAPYISTYLYLRTLVKG